MLGLTFYSKLDWGFYIVSVAKLTSKKIGALIRFIRFLSPEVALYLYKSTIQPCMEYCCHVQVGAPNSYLELLERQQKQKCRTVGPSLAACLEALTHCGNVASLSLFYMHYFGRCLSELAELVPLPYSHGKCTHYFDRLHDFSVTIPRCYKDVYVISFFLCTARLWNSLPVECFPLTNDLNGFECRSQQTPNCSFFLNRFPVCFNLFVLLFSQLHTFYWLFQPCMQLILIKNNKKKTPK